jgi:hypothetical protein
MFPLVVPAIMGVNFATKSPDSPGLISLGDNSTEISLPVGIIDVNEIGSVERF